MRDRKRVRVSGVRERGREGVESERKSEWGERDRERVRERGA